MTAAAADNDDDDDDAMVLCAVVSIMADVRGCYSIHIVIRCM